MNPKYSIVIPTYNNTQGLMRCLSAIVQNAQQEQAPTEVIVVSNGPEAIRHQINSMIGANPKPSPFVKLKHLHSSTMGFSPACNLGMREARGDFIVLLNDDTVPAPNALREMVGAMETAKNVDPTVTPGFAGPMLNKVKGIQEIPDDGAPFIHDPAMVLQTERFLAHSIDSGGPEVGDFAKVFKTTQENPTPFVPSIDISGVCLMITRDCFEAVKYLEVFGLGGWEDNDYCIRAVEAGFAGVVALRAFVYHEMNVTYRTLDPNNRNSTSTIDQFLRKWNKPAKAVKTLCASYYVKIDTRGQMELLLTSLSRMHSLADQAVIFDDRSTMNIREALEQQGLLSFVTKLERKEEGERDEPTDRNRLLQLAQATGCDWIWNLDHDEWPDERCTPQLLQRLLNPINPQTMAYIIPLSTFWRGAEKVRVDGIWGRMKNRSLHRNLPAFGQILPNGESNYHCERAPAFLPLNARGYTYAFSVEHWGYYDYEGVKQKQKYYQETDKVKNVRLIGTKNYEHLTDEGSMSLLPFGIPTCTLLLMARNEKFDVLKSLYLHRDQFTEAIVVSNGSVDGTDELAALMGAKTVRNLCCDQAESPDHMTCDFAAARNFAIEQCQTDYIMFLDPDEILTPSSMVNFDKLLLENFDGYLCNINNFNRDAKGNQVNYPTKQPRLFKNRPEIRYNDEVHEVLEKAFKTHTHLIMTEGPVVIDHHGFLKTTPAQRQRRNDLYAEKLMKVIERDPENYRALHALAVHFRDKGETETAMNLMLRSVESHPDFFISRWDLALLYVDEIHRLITTLPPQSRPDGDPRWQAAVQLVRSLGPFINPMKKNAA